MISNSQFDSRISFVGSGSATPQKVIVNDQLGQRVETNDEWIKSRTGIHKRRVIGKNESLIDLATDAARKAMNMAKCDEKTIDFKSKDELSKEEDVSVYEKFLDKINLPYENCSI